MIPIAGKSAFPLGRSFEEADLGKSSRRLTRTFSSPQLDRVQDVPALRKGLLEELENAEIANKDGVLWECIDRICNQRGGYIYIFRLRQKYDSMTLQRKMRAIKGRLLAEDSSEQRISLLRQLVMVELDEIHKAKRGRDKVKSIFPAIEVRKFDELSRLSEEPYISLGYSLNYNEKGVKISLPDKEALEKNWEAYRLSADRKLPRLEIYLSKEGVASDRSFIEGHLQYDGVLSPRGEFVHDHLLHIMSTIEHLLDARADRGKLIKQFALGYRTLILAEKQFRSLNRDADKLAQFEEKIEVMWAGLGVFVDVLTSDPRKINMLGQYAVRHAMTNFLNDPHWRSYIENRFDAEKVQNIRSGQFWHELRKLQSMHDEACNLSKIPKALFDMDANLFKRAGQKLTVPVEDGSQEVYAIKDLLKFQFEVEYLVQGSHAEVVLIHGKDVRIGEAVNLEERPVLVDIACQFAVAHQYGAVYLKDIPHNWPLYFELGFRFQYPYENLNEALLIEYATSLNLLSAGELRLLQKLAQSSEKMYAPLNGPGEEKLPLTDQKSGLFHTCLEIINPILNLTFDKPCLALDDSVFDNWLNAVRSESWDGGSIVRALGQIKLDADLADLRNRMQTLNERYFWIKSTEYPAELSCSIL